MVYATAWDCRNEEFVMDNVLLRREGVLMYFSVGRDQRPAEPLQTTLGNSMCKFLLVYHAQYHSTGDERHVSVTDHMLTLLYVQVHLLLSNSLLMFPHLMRIVLVMS